MLEYHPLWHLIEIVPGSTSMRPDCLPLPAEMLGLHGLRVRAIDLVPTKMIQTGVAYVWESVSRLISTQSQDSLIPEEKDVVCRAGRLAGMDFFITHLWQTKGTW